MKMENSYKIVLEIENGLPVKKTKLDWKHIDKTKCTFCSLV